MSRTNEPEADNENSLKSRVFKPRNLILALLGVFLLFVPPFLSAEDKNIQNFLQDIHTWIDVSRELGFACLIALVISFGIEGIIA